MSTKSFFAAGTPATFATSGEIPWRDAVVEQAPSPCFNGDEDGLSLEFTLESFVRQGHHFDVDNLCEPVLYALVGQRAWFQGKRARIRWLRATKRVASPLGCHITVSCGKTPELPSEAPDWDEEYTGILPTSARSPELATWARELRVSRGVNWIPNSCCLYLDFPTGSTNLGDVSTGVVKAFIDCLYPWLGGVEQRPQDHRIHELIVAKGHSGTVDGGVLVRLWAHGRIPSVLPLIPSAEPEPPRVASSRRPSRELARPSSGPIRNPSPPGTGKHIVCEGALQGKSLAEVTADLDRNVPGTGRRLREYMSDLRSENRLDIRIEDGKLVCYGFRARSK